MHDLSPTHNVFRYYESFYSCMSDWLQSQDNCSREVVAVILDGILRFTEPFTSTYNCSVVASRTTPGWGFVIFLLILFCTSSIIARVLRHLALVDRTPAPLAYLTLPSVKDESNWLLTDTSTSSTTTSTTTAKVTTTPSSELRHYFSLKMCYQCFHTVCVVCARYEVLHINCGLCKTRACLS